MVTNICRMEMDFIEQLGALALASRLRRTAERLTQDVALLYRELDIAFEPRWFLVFALLNQQSPRSVMDIARELGITHPAVNQIAGELIEQGLVRALPDASDKRKRLLALTHQGEALQRSVQPVWDGIRHALADLLEDDGVALLQALSQLEARLAQRSIYARFFDVVEDAAWAKVAARRSQQDACASHTQELP